jgi:hypothetical protein
MIAASPFLDWRDKDQDWGDDPRIVRRNVSSLMRRRNNSGRDERIFRAAIVVGGAK